MNSPKAFAVCIAFVVLFSLRSSADKVDDYIRAEMERQHIPGLSLAVAKKGELKKSAGYGVANIEQNSPVTANTIFQIQSITKTFTATAIMMLVEEGKIQIEDKITQHLPNLPESWNGITVRHLLTHTSGIKDFINEPIVNKRLDLTAEEVIDSLRKLPLNFEPGEKYTYCNTGYHLLGMIIHKVTGKLWGEFLQERVFDPLGMKDTRIVSWPEIIPNRAAGYLWEDGRVQNGHFLAPTILAYAGGGLRSTALDMAKWDAALCSEIILKQSVLQQMWTPAKFNNGKDSTYGFGWGIEKSSGQRLISHTGSHMTGFKSAILRYMDDGLTVIVLTNQRGANQTAIAKGVAAFYSPEIKSSE